MNANKEVRNALKRSKSVARHGRADADLKAARARLSGMTHKGVRLADSPAVRAALSEHNRLLKG